LDNIKLDLSEKELISYDSHEILILFKNGRLVEFGNSEWAHISLGDINDKLIEL